MNPSDLINYAFYRAYLDTLSPKKRRAFLASVTEMVGEPGVIPCIKPEAAMQVSLARETWAKMLPKLT
jgi:hypothetical protein